MILSGPEIAVQVSLGRILISPFDQESLNPNSYNYHLGAELQEVTNGSTAVIHLESDKGTVLRPGALYLGATLERIGSTSYTPSLIGRSSIGRLGVFLQIDADHGQLGGAHCWTLEIRVTVPVEVYAGMPIGQVSFWACYGDATREAAYHGRYVKRDDPMASHLKELLERG